MLVIPSVNLSELANLTMMGYLFVVTMFLLLEPLAWTLKPPSWPLFSSCRSLNLHSKDFLKSVLDQITLLFKGSPSHWDRNPFPCQSYQAPFSVPLLPLVCLRNHYSQALVPVTSWQALAGPGFGAHVCNECYHILPSMVHKTVFFLQSLTMLYFL